MFMASSSECDTGSVPLPPASEVFHKGVSKAEQRLMLRGATSGEQAGRYVFPPGIRSWWWRRLSRRAVFSMQRVFKSDALGDDWLRRSADLPLIGAASEE
ncbi:hypothetical protein ATANTOWER_028838 [Ataeniobius toweri]|uniref:Uncharacterized protein n=1 Tax=Ataeniobius toweri TaxID=208326 RepID=A0ABU7CDF8_9TELE|nr:hypothetical protein [Ataeniobius toweri]